MITNINSPLIKTYTTRFIYLQNTAFKVVVGNFVSVNVVHFWLFSCTVGTNIMYSHLYSVFQVLLTTQRVFHYKSYFKYTFIQHFILYTSIILSLAQPVSVGTWEKWWEHRQLLWQCQRPLWTLHTLLQFQDSLKLSFSHTCGSKIHLNRYGAN